MVRGIRILFGCLIVAMFGCNSLIGKRPASSGAGNGTPRGSMATLNGKQGSPKTLAIPTASSRDTPMPDPSTMIPPPPEMNVPPIPDAPPKEDRITQFPLPNSDQPGDILPVSASRAVPGSSGANVPPKTPASTNSSAPVTPSVSAPPATAPGITEKGLDAVKRLHRQATERFLAMDGFEAKLTRRETVNGRAMPEEVMHYRYRREPHSVHLKWIGLENQGRELVYSGGRPDAKVSILTGKHEGLLIPAGKRFTYAPTDSTVRSKSRHDLRESGMGMGLLWTGKVIAIVERDPAQANRLRYIGRKERLERKSGLDAIEEQIPPNWEPVLPQGGQRTTYYDPDPSSPSFGLPVLVVTLDGNGREVEYYSFEHVKPIKPTDADFDPDRIWKR
jgi:Protein of unknown function (DUF1571)